MSVTRTCAEMEIVSTRLGRSTVTARKGTRASSVMIRQLAIQGTTRRYSMNT